MATNYLCQADLLKRRNWNLRRIRQFLDPPDTVSTNPKSERYREMKLYLLSRIIRIENSEAFLQDVQLSRKYGVPLF
jgi:hypothetical protein